jgi:E-phenylitaconyl-CoA hydratase
VNEVLYEERERIAYITLNRPEAMNALNTPLRQLLHDVLTRFRDSNDAWVAIITGAGDRAFSAGADLKEMSVRNKELHAGGGDAFWDAETPTLNRGLKIWKPIIAAINGYCLAGGLELALACDIRVATESASFALTEVMRGILPGGGGTQRLPRLVPFGVALEMLFTGDRIDAREAYRIALVNHVVPAERLMQEAERIARRILENAPLSVRAIKESAYRGSEVPLEEGLRIEGFLSRIIRTTEDSVEGPTAFAEKRPAQWKGR